jgi:predicted DNA-binding transcriptional regulator AlpA
MENENVFLITQEVAELTRLSPRTLEKKRVMGNGPKYYRAGGRVLYRREDVINWIENNVRRSTSDPGQAAA